MTKTTRDTVFETSDPHRRFSSSRCKLAALRRALLPALLLGTSALAGCATYIPPEISYDAEVPPLPAPPVALDDRPQPLHVPPLWKPALGGKSGGEGRALNP